MTSKSLGVAAIVVCLGCLCFGLWAAGPRIIHGINVKNWVGFRFIDDGDGISDPIVEGVDTSRFTQE